MASIVTPRVDEEREEGTGWGWGCHFQSICFQYTCSESTKMLLILDNLSSLANILWPMDISPRFSTKTPE